MIPAVQAAVDPAVLLDELLRHPSPTGHVDAAARLLVERTREAGFDSHVDAAGNVVMRWGDGAPSSDVLLLGHLDTVPGDIPVRLHEGRLHGRGAVDAKGPLVAALAAVSSLPAHHAPVTVVAACDEEGPSLGARHLRDRRAPSALIVLEPSGWRSVTTGYRGCLRLTATIERPSAHHASPQPASADVLVSRLAQLQARLRSDGGAAGRDGARAVDSVQLRVNSLSSARRTDIETTTAALELRIPSSTTVDTLIATVQDTLGDAHVAVGYACEAVSVQRSNRVVRSLARAITGAGSLPRYTTKTGTCDLNVVWPGWRCDAAVYGPGDCSLDHTPHESIEVDELRRGSAVLQAAVAALR
jgi:LysW-gamma-L-lysine carboxypeptidase